MFRRQLAVLVAAVITARPTCTFAGTVFKEEMPSENATAYQELRVKTSWTDDYSLQSEVDLNDQVVEETTTSSANTVVETTTMVTTTTSDVTKIKTTEVEVIIEDTTTEIDEEIEDSDSEEIEYAEESSSEDIQDESVSTWSGAVLTKSGGVVPADNTPSGYKETWYNYDMYGCLDLLGWSYDGYSVRDDGVKLYNGYVMVASPNLSVWAKGDLVETTLGTGIVVDFCSAGNLDIAVTW